MFVIILGECPYELIDEFLLFTLQLLINDKLLTNEKFTILKRKAANLTFQDAQNMVEVNMYMQYYYLYIYIYIYIYINQNI